MGNSPSLPPPTGSYSVHSHTRPLCPSVLTIMKPTASRLLNILVPVKRTVDYAVKIRVNSAQTAVETNGVKHSMNPFDEIAVEEAVRLRERLKDQVKSIKVVTIGSSKASDVLRTALAMGADTGIHIETDASFPEPSLQPLLVAKALKALVADKAKDTDLIIMGKQAIDDDASQTGGMLAGLLDWPIANFASKLDIQGKSAEVDREIDGGLEKIKLSLPAVVTTDLRLNEPRYATLPNIMKAKKKKIEKYTMKDLGIDEQKEVRLETIKVTEPPKRKGGAKVASVDEMVEKLKGMGVV